MIEQKLKHAVTRSNAVLELQRLGPLQDDHRRKLDAVIHFGNVLASLLGLLDSLKVSKDSTEDELQHLDRVLGMLVSVNPIYMARLLEVIRTHKLYADFSFLLAESEFGFEFNNALEEWKSETSSDNCN